MWLRSSFTSLLLLAGTSCIPDQTAKVGGLEARVAALEAKVSALSLAKPTAPPPPAPTKPPKDAQYEAPEAGWTMSGGGRDVYEVHVDPLEQREGHSTVRLAPTADAHDKYGTWARTLDAKPYGGKRVRFSILTKTEGTTARADFWARVQAVDSPGDGPGLGGHSTFLPASSGWTRREIVLDVDPKGDRFNYGVGIAGPGKLWFDDPKLEVVGPDVPVTPTFPGEQTVGDWLMTGVGAPDFAFTADGKDAHIERSVATSQRFVAVVHTVASKPFVGKTVKASFDVRTDGLDSEGMCILKVQTGRDLSYGGILKFDKQSVEPSTKGFKHCNLTASIPEDAKWILYGFTYRGGGKAWVRGGTLK